MTGFMVMMLTGIFILTTVYYFVKELRVDAKRKKKLL